MNVLKMIIRIQFVMTSLAFILAIMSRVLCASTSDVHEEHPDGVFTQPESVISVHADQVKFRLSDESIGANMEDLHYQMVGGFDSQLIHGESFFEPSPTELAQKTGRVHGFTSVQGAWFVLPEGRLRADIKGGIIGGNGEVPAAAGIAPDDKK